MPEKCSICGLFYASNDSEDEVRHAIYHGEFLSTDDPQPDQLIARIVDLQSGLVTFHPTDPDHLHKKLHDISRRFAREMGEKIAWAERGCLLEEGSIGVIFSDDVGRVLGGAGVYQNPKGYKDVEYLIGWIWVAPPYRRKGVFERALPALVKKFPGAFLNPPYSDGLRRFADKSRYIVGENDGPLCLSLGDV